MLYGDKVASFEHRKWQQPIEDEQSIKGGRWLAVGRNGKMGDGQFGTWHELDYRPRLIILPRFCEQFIRAVSRLRLPC